MIFTNPGHGMGSYCVWPLRFVVNVLALICQPAGHSFRNGHWNHCPPSPGGLMALPIAFSPSNMQPRSDDRIIKIVEEY